VANCDLFVGDDTRRKQTESASEDGDSAKGTVEYWSKHR